MKFDFHMSPAERISPDDIKSQRTGKLLFYLALFLYLLSLSLMIVAAGLADGSVPLIRNVAMKITVLTSLMLIAFAVILFLVPSRTAGMATTVGLTICFLSSASMPFIDGMLTGANPQWTQIHGVWCLSLMFASAAFLLPLLYERYIEGLNLND